MKLISIICSIGLGVGLAAAPGRGQTKTAPALELGSIPKKILDTQRRPGQPCDNSLAKEAALHVSDTL